MNHSSKIFEMLGVKPNEVFKLEESDLYYQITKDLDLLWSAYPNKRFLKSETRSIIHLLTGEFTIKKITEFTVTPKEKTAIDYARACGCYWIAKDKYKSIHAFDCKPVKSSVNYGYWVPNNKSSFKMMLLRIPISFIKWEDEEPFYIGPEVTFKVVDECESININETSCICEYFDNVTGTCINTNKCLSNGRKDKCQYSNGNVTLNGFKFV